MPFTTLLVLKLLIIINSSDGFLLDSVSPSKVQVLLTTGDQHNLLSRQPDLYPTGGSSGTNIYIDKTKRFQRMEGFGAAFSNSAAYVIYNSPRRHSIMQDLFSKTNGIGVSCIRITMGGSDLQAVPPYSYDDMPHGQTDFNMDHFSIDKDKAFFIPIIKEALSLNPDLKIIASPWSAPAWMKSNDNLYGGSFHQDPDGRYQRALALYFVKFIQAYAAEGIPITSITIQNEPEFQTSGYPSMKLPWNIERDLIKWHLGPLFLQNKIYTRILIYDHNWDGLYYPENIVQDHDAAQYISGVAWHCYNGDKSAATAFHAKYPDFDHYFTECTGTNAYTNFESNMMWNFDNLFIHQPRNWAKAVLYWNIALDDHWGPQVQVSGCKDCRGVITVPQGSNHYTKEVEYYVIGHMTKVVQTQAVRIESTDNVNGMRTVAFENPDGSTALVVSNPQSHSQTFMVHIGSSQYQYTIPAKSVVSMLHSE